MIASFDSNPVGYDEGGTERASGKKRVARDDSALMKIWQRASSVCQPDFWSGSLTEGVYEVDQSPSFVLILEQYDWDLVNEDCRILRSDCKVVCGTEWLLISHIIRVHI